MIASARSLWLTAALAALATPAQAHFVWVSVEAGGDGRPEARVWFSEDPSPGAPHLVSKIAHTRLECRDGAQTMALELEPVTADGAGELVGKLPAGEGPIRLEAVCDYGVFSRGGPPILLQYYAKALRPRTPDHLVGLARSEGLPLDIVPEATAEGLRFTVLWQGKPAANTEIFVLDIEGEDETLTTDDKGQALHRHPGQGLIAARAGHVEDQRSGERNGQRYDSVRHYTTLTLRLPPGAATAAAPRNVAAPETAEAAEGLTASELLANARAARAVWSEFPGFTAEVTLSADGETSSGRLTVDESGEVTLDLPSSDGLKWARRQLASLVSHRMPDGEIGSGASYVAESGRHPLGRLIRLEGESMGSVYRIRDNVVTEVNRDNAGGRFTISVLDVLWNEDHKYLPTAFNVSSWEQPSGRLRSSHTVFQRWERVGAFDLPTVVFEVEATEGARHVRQLELREHRLIEQPATAGATAAGR